MLRADCARCAGLCCVALAFDRSALFAIDKPAGKPCLHLTPANHCGIHAHLGQHGFAGCAAYDCLGAGQRVSQQIFPGRSWRESPALARAIFTAFYRIRQVHELLLLLRLVARQKLTPPQRARRAELEAALQPTKGWSVEALALFACGPAEADIHAFLGSLRARSRARPRSRRSA